MKKKINIILYGCLLFASQISWGQVGINRGSPKATLEINSSMLMPRVALLSITDAVTVTNPQGGALVDGTMVYNTGAATLKQPGFYAWINGKWSFIQREEVGDIKYSMQTADHDGWYLLEGRLTSSLAGVAKTNGILLFGANLPNARNKALKQRAGSETIGQTVGNPFSGLTILSSNLPSLNFSGLTDTKSHVHGVTSNAAGNHRHQYQDMGSSSTLHIPFTESDENPMSLGESETTKFTNSVSHSHTYSFASVGNHNHTVNPVSNAGGSSVPIDLTMNKLILNTFVYLGKD